MSKPFNLEYLGEHNHISIEDAQRFHAILLKKHNITDPDEIVADWNRRDPEAPWGSGIIGKYVHELTEIVCAFMVDKVEEARAKKEGGGK